MAFGRKKYGNMYFRKLEDNGKEGELMAGEAFNDGTEPYRGIIYELKTTDFSNTAKL